MKRYLFGIFAVALAFTAVAFKAPEKKLVTKLFRYNPPTSNPYSMANVQDKSRWQYVTDPQTCTVNNNQKACELQVNDDPTYINPDNTLSSSFSITAALWSGNIHYVSGISSGGGTIQNRIN
jgi:hypothetical protein